jgi:hypothetical protein
VTGAGDILVAEWSGLNINSSSHLSRHSNFEEHPVLERVSRPTIFSVVVLARLSDQISRDAR